MKSSLSGIVGPVQALRSIPASEINAEYRVIQWDRSVPDPPGCGLQPVRDIETNSVLPRVNL